jgi:hypothetical protein
VTAHVHLHLKQGDTFALQMVWTLNGAPLDMATYTLASQVRTRLGFLVGSFTFSDGTASNIVIATAGSTAFWPPGELLSDVQLTDSEGNVTHTMTFPIRCIASITGATGVQPSFAVGGFGGGFPGSSGDGIDVSITQVGTTTPVVVISQIGGAIFATYADGIAAAGSEQAEATPVSSSYNVITTCAAGAGVILTAFSPCSIKNDTDTLLTVYPLLGTQIESFGVNEPVSIAAGGVANFALTSPGQWRQF